jgi:1,6-anhydro-N-acetylmuramate kinase
MHTQTHTHTPRRSSTVVSTRAVLRPKMEVSKTGTHFVYEVRRHRLSRNLRSSTARHATPSFHRTLL